jgi:hypothetical protein
MVYELCSIGGDLEGIGVEPNDVAKVQAAAKMLGEAWGAFYTAALGESGPSDDFKAAMSSITDDFGNIDFRRILPGMTPGIHPDNPHLYAAYMEGIRLGRQEGKAGMPRSPGEPLLQQRGEDGHHHHHGGGGQAEGGHQ